MRWTKEKLEGELSKIFEQITGKRMYFEQSWGNCSYKKEQLMTIYKWFELNKDNLKFLDKKEGVAEDE